MKTLTKLSAIVLLSSISVSTHANQLTTDVTSELSSLISNTITNSIHSSIEELKATTRESVSFSLDNVSIPTTELTENQTTPPAEVKSHGK
ncbi:hypothetical protein PSECIP111951_03552 [Pseudoalteromonas holothuriae]|uniref:Uncharacterized protein n=1 Tax=Pseudoalteromonas holothuriae TaxID=2963714 RepID=A0A9W4R570_9GAMM|nr:MULTISPECIES: hypothetical protein [unclassified Pseudoalteromonas]CAH9066321.1 hypothetical protein PSECIP111951_03552 [Pseudoalteromonas sp. CIP111951]CAH9067458.1 hypothetical protein PSECIP111854_04111 [Pseudoalteromonas sp. CIP111854]